MAQGIIGLVTTRDPGIRDWVTCLWRKRLGLQTLSSQLRGHDRLHLGCGGHLLPGWANLDRGGAVGVICHDLTRPIPMAAGSVRFIYSEHFLEHISRERGRVLLAECRRLLQPGGVLRLSTPDLAVLIREYQAGRTDEWAELSWRPDSPCALMNEGMRLWGHQFVYDWDELTRTLAEVGFREITRCDWRQSGHAELQGLECRPWHGELIVEAA